jgi:hypothetical protein
LHETVTEWFLIFSVLHKLTMGFAVIGVINGIFIQETFSVASSDDTLMLMQRQRALRVHTRKMERLFAAADSSGDGFVDKEEFRNILEKPHVQTWLAAQELDASDADKLFDLLNKGHNVLSAAELVKGVARLKGPSRSIDLSMLSHHHRQLQEALDSVAMRIHSIERHVALAVGADTQSRISAEQAVMPNGCLNPASGDQSLELVDETSYELKAYEMDLDVGAPLGDGRFGSDTGGFHEVLQIRETSGEAAYSSRRGGLPGRSVLI